ncbi:MAG: thiamine-phosphate kinase [Betaproteobacteria bacterium]|nr:thiamine-phosphate kinase [Betaproteobacteria bacterium]
MTAEFELIRKYFHRATPSAVLGVGDDCALVQPRQGMALAISTDMLLEGRHFLPGTDPRRLGRKSLAVNLSDLAAMGADPRWATLGLAIPDTRESWLKPFAAGLFEMACEHGVELIGGDTTRGPLTVSITIMGELPLHLALRRDGALAGDDVWLSGSTGDAALGLACLLQDPATDIARLDAAARAHCIARLEDPTPRVELGGRLRGIARSAIDVSDGLLADLGHVLEASHVRAELNWEALPRSAAIASCADAGLARNCLLAGGDDYELVFTAPPFRRAEVEAVARDVMLPLTRIGIILEGSPHVVVRAADGSKIDALRQGYDHFQS